jgi:hypothetical protein
LQNTPIALLAGKSAKPHAYRLTAQLKGPLSLRMRSMLGPEWFRCSSDGNPIGHIPEDFK